MSRLVTITMVLSVPDDRDADDVTDVVSALVANGLDETYSHSDDDVDDYDVKFTVVDEGVLAHARDAGYAEDDA